jgi:hypothetical protein
VFLHCLPLYTLVGVVVPGAVSRAVTGLEEPHEIRRLSLMLQAGMNPNEVDLHVTVALTHGVHAKHLVRLHRGNWHSCVQREEFLMFQSHHSRTDNKPSWFVSTPAKNVLADENPF